MLPTKDCMKKELLDFSLEVIGIYRKLVFEEKDFVVSKFLLKAGTSIGVCFCKNELESAYKMAAETEFWLEIITRVLVEDNPVFTVEKEALFLFLKNIKEKLEKIINYLEREC